MVCTKTLYNYIDIGLLDIKNTDLPIKLRRNTKPTRIKKHKKNLGTSIAKYHIDIRTEFGHWKVDTVIGEKSNNAERKTRYAIILGIVAKTSNAVTDALTRIPYPI